MKSKYRKNFSLAIGCLLSVTAALSTIGETWYLGRIAGELGVQGGRIWRDLAVVIVMLTLEYLSNTFGGFVKQMTRRRIVTELRRQLFDKSVRTEYRRLKERDSGDLNSLYLSDVDVIGQYASLFMDSFGQIAGGAAALLVCVRISWKFLLISLCVFPVMLLPGALAGRGLKKYAYEVQQKKGASASVLLDALRNRNMLKSFSAQEYMLARFAGAAGAENQAVMRESVRRGAAGGVNRICGSLPYLAIFAVGGALIFRGEIEIGGFFAFAYIFSNVQSLQSILELRVAKKGCEAAQSRLNEFLVQPEEEPEGIAAKMPEEPAGNAVEMPEEPEGIAAEMRSEAAGIAAGMRSEEAAEIPGAEDGADGLLLCNVSFSYGDGPDVLRGITLYIEKGSSVGFVGESGSGKSTLLGLLTGLYMPKEGTVRYCAGGSCYEGSACREKMSVVFQDNYVFPTTVRENLLMGRPDASDEELRSACEAAGVWEDVEKMPDGLDTALSELGQSLSGGQRQRICIARALVRKPEILILDEPSASLDTVHEMQLMERLTEIMKEGILIVVSHRPSSIGRLGTVYSLQDGSLRVSEVRS